MKQCICSMGRQPAHLHRDWCPLHKTKRQKKIDPPEQKPLPTFNSKLPMSKRLLEYELLVEEDLIG